MAQQQWAKASTGSEPRYEENLTETSQYDRSEMIFPIITGVAVERDKHNRPILKPDSFSQVSESGNLNIALKKLYKIQNASYKYNRPNDIIYRGH